MLAGYTKEQAEKGAKKFQYTDTFKPHGQGLYVYKPKKSIVVSKIKSLFEREMEVLEKRVEEDLKAVLGAE